MEAEDYQFEPDHPSGKPRFDGTINLGHILTMLSMGMAIATVWVNMKVSESDHDARLKALERSQARIDETVTKLADNAAASQRTQDKLTLTLEYLAKSIPSKP